MLAQREVSILEFIKNSTRSGVKQPVIVHPAVNRVMEQGNWTISRGPFQCLLMYDFPVQKLDTCISSKHLQFNIYLSQQWYKSLWEWFTAIEKTKNRVLELHCRNI